MKLATTYCKVYIIELLRNRTALFFTLLFPALLMLMVGRGANPASSSSLLGVTIVFCNYAVQTIAFQVLGMNISASRNSDWSLFLRTLPVSPTSMFAGRILSMLIYAFISMSVIIFIHAIAHHGQLSLEQWVLIMLVSLLGGIPMALLGIGLGYYTNPSAARGAFVLVNLGLLFAAFSFPEHGLLSYIRNIMPTYEWMMISFNLLTHASPLIPLLWLLAYTVIFYFFAITAYKHKRNTRFE